MPGADDEGSTPLAEIGVLAAQEVEISPTMRHLELFSLGGLLTVLWHGDGSERRALVACGGAMGGLLGPADGLYHRLGEELVGHAVATLRVGYRRPNDLDACTLDLAAAVQLATGNGAESVVVAGHSFGGAVAIRTAVALPDLVAGVCTFATQSAGCEVAGNLGERPLLLFHGDRDEILPLQASYVVQTIAGHGEVVVVAGDGHLLSKSGPFIRQRFLEWLWQIWPDAGVPR